MTDTTDQAPQPRAALNWKADTNRNSTFDQGNDGRPYRSMFDADGVEVARIYGTYCRRLAQQLEELTAGPGEPQGGSR